MPKGSAELTHARREEIISACRELYETGSFKEITMKEIGRMTSFTRTSIYNYFETREEIFLALFQQEYELFAEDLNSLCEREDSLSLEGLASALARASAQARAQALAPSPWRYPRPPSPACTCRDCASSTGAARGVKAMPICSPIQPTRRSTVSEVS